MNEDLKIVKVDSKYVDYLRTFDDKVPYNFKRKENRPFVGALFSIDNMMFFVPLSSPKPKHKTIKNGVDFIKIDGGNLGALNFNNMIVVCENNIEFINLDSDPKDTDEETKYKILLNNQLVWLRKNNVKIKDKAKLLYDSYKEDSLYPNVKARCCNWPLLEEKCREYNNQ
jgi:protein AbiQ